MSKEILFVILIFLVWFIVVVFQIYIRRRRLSTEHLRHIIVSDAVWTRGLDSSVVSALPTFVYEHPQTEGPPLECTVCLSEFEGGEKGRVMPDCNHRFHAECIDMWLMSHGDCPLCRTRVTVNRAAGDPVEDSRGGTVPMPFPVPGPCSRPNLLI